MKHKRAAAPANHERWLVSYADFITLLFAFFVVLYASSQVDKGKMMRLAIAIEGAFHQLGVFQGSVPGPPVTPEPSGSGGNAEDQKEAPPHAERQAIKLAVPARMNAPAMNAADLVALKRELELALASEINNHEVVLRTIPEGLVISLSELAFFDSGSAVMRSDARPSFTRIAKLLIDRSVEIRVEGHTDNVPIHNAQFQSNWELSTARAVEVIKMLIVTYDCAPGRLSAAGYGQFHPVASNDTSNGRQQNRRVDLVILAKMYSPGTTTDTSLRAH